MNYDDLTPDERVKFNAIIQGEIQRRASESLAVITTSDLPTPADQNPAVVYIASLTSEASRRTMLQALNAIAGMVSSGSDVRSFQWAALRFQHTSAIRARLAGQHKPATVNKMLSALRGTLKAAYNLGLIPPDEYTKATSIKAVKGETIPAGRELEGGELIALGQACKADKTPAGKRDRAMLAMLYTCGFRRAELAALQIGDIEAATGKITIQRGKGRKSRIVYATNGALTALQIWIMELDKAGVRTGAVFCNIGRRGTPNGKQMTTQAVYVMLKKRATEAGVKNFSPHDLRRTFVSDLLDRGADIVTVQKLAGHASPTTTARYDRRGEETKKKAAGLLHFPG